MPDYFDPHATARVAGYQHGLIDGDRQGYQRGLRDGEENGYRIGWDEAVSAANANMGQQLAYTRQHVADKQALALRLEEAHRHIARLTKALEESREATARLQETNLQLADGVKTLFETNESQKAQMDALAAQLQKRKADDRNERLRFNRCAVFANVTRSVLEALLSDPAHSTDTRASFLEHYTARVGAAVAEGVVPQALHLDPVVNEQMPGVAKFLAAVVSRKQDG